MVKKQKLFVLQKLPPRQHSAYLEDWQNFHKYLQKIGKFLKLGVTFILGSMLTALLLAQTKFTLM